MIGVGVIGHGYRGPNLVRCSDQGLTPLTDGEAGLRIVRILEAAAGSMRHRGRSVDVSWNQTRG